MCNEFILFNRHCCRQNVCWKLLSWYNTSASYPRYMQTKHPFISSSLHLQCAWRMLPAPHCPSPWLARCYRPDLFNKHLTLGIQSKFTLQMLLRLSHFLIVRFVNRSMHVDKCSSKNQYIHWTIMLIRSFHLATIFMHIDKHSCSSSHISKIKPSTAYFTLNNLNISPLLTWSFSEALAPFFSSISTMATWPKVDARCSAVPFHWWW